MILFQYLLAIARNPFHLGFYFPPESIRREFFNDSSEKSVCAWKGVASYYDVDVDGCSSPAAAWYYPDTKDAAKEIEGYVAFWRGVSVEE